MDIFPNPKQVTPSTSLLRAIASKHSLSFICSGTGCCKRIPWTSGFLFNLSISVSNSDVDMSEANSTFKESIPILSQAFAFILT